MTNTKTKFTVGSVWRTRDGRKATVLATDLDSPYPLAVKVYYLQREYAACLLSNGCVYNNGDINNLDLLEPWREPVTVSGWAALYPTGELSNLYKTKQQAEDVSRNAFPVLYITGTEEVGK